MTELADIFAHDLTTMVFVSSSITMLIAFAIAAIWALSAARGKAMTSTNRAWIGPNSSSAAAATPV